MKVKLDIPHYSPSKKEIGLLPESSMYVRFHEIAHSYQEKSLAFKIWWYTAKISLLYPIHKLATQYLEIDAFIQARRAMLKLGIWHRHEREAVNALATYFEDCEQPPHVKM